MAARRLLSVAAFAVAAQAATVTYDFNITWVTANPDGLADRPVIGINGQWPIPRIEATIGDQVVVHVHNQLGNESTTLHFHGLFMNGTTQMDGPSQVSQCAIPPGNSFTYNFTINQPGTYWYHSHTMSQYPDGLRGALVVHDPDSPFKDMYDEEVVLTISDWYHDEMQGLIQKFMSKGNPTGAEPAPKSAIFNDMSDVSVKLQPGKTYLVRMVNIGAFASQYFWMEGHNMSIVEVDGVYTRPTEASMIYLSAAQRCSFLLTAKDETAENYAFVASMDTDLFDKIPANLNWNVTGWLVYDETKALPEAALVDELDAFDDWTLVPYDNKTILAAPDQTISLDVVMNNLDDGANYAFFNNITYKSPVVPTLYTALTSGPDAANPAVYGEYTHSFVLAKGEIVEIIVNNLDTGKHPFHLHGHEFQAVWRSAEDAGPFQDSNVTEADLPAIPMRRDTFVVRPGGNIVLRFQANNPGVWLFHCHIEWHVASGLMATMVEAPLELQKSLTLPQDHLDVCAAGRVPVAGNAAGNTANLLDLSGQNAPPGPLPAGFTARGIVALVFSCLSGILGIAVVAWYGFAEVKPETYARAQHRIDEAAVVVPSAGEAELVGASAPAPASKTEVVEEVTVALGGGARPRAV